MKKKKKKKRTDRVAIEIEQPKQTPFVATRRGKLHDFMVATLAAVAAAVIIAVGAFALDVALPTTNVAGHWYCLTLTDDGYSRHEGMLFLHDVFLQVNGEAITGSAEKFAEYSSDPSGYLRPIGQITSLSGGTLHRRRFADDDVSIVINEARADGRTTTLSYDMTSSGGRMAGAFRSTAGDQVGRVVCKRSAFDLTGGVDKVRQRLEAEIDDAPRRGVP